ncbi:MAG: hypothetical protein ABIY71_03070, partial [Flavobacteriales bacterium]
YWEDAGQPTSQVAARVCYTDTVHDVLIVGGASYLLIDSLHGYYPLYRYDGTHWDTLGLFGGTINTAVVFRDTLIVGGAFKTIHGDTIERVACYVNGGWHPYGNIDNGSYVGSVRTLRVLEGELYALGTFQHVTGQPCNGVAKRFGGHWECLPSLPEFYGTPYMYDIARFQGKLVVAGNFMTLDETIYDMMQFDGTSWLAVCDNCMRGGMDGAAALIVYQDELYMGGRYYYGGGNAGQGIMRWDGEEWNPVGPVEHGVQLDNYSDQYPPSIYGFQIRDGRLFFNGEAGFVNHMPTPGIASWDGTDFCNLGDGDLGLTASAFAFYHDSLYVSTGPSGTIGRGLVRYLSTDFQEECSTLPVDEVPVSAEETFQVAWSPSGELTLLGLTDGVHRLRIHDPQGRLVLLKMFAARPVVVKLLH